MITDSGDQGTRFVYELLASELVNIEHTFDFYVKANEHMVENGVPESG